MTDNIRRMYRLAGTKEIRYDQVVEGHRVKYYAFPPFTPEKQLELIKWFGKNSIMKKVYDIYNREDFSQALAGLVCEIWEDLTDEQREEVRGIIQ